MRELGLKLIAANQYVGDAISLFTKNYRNGDEQIFMKILDQATDPETLHAIGFSLVEVFAANPTKAALPLLLYLYEHGPCSLCRTHVVQHLAEVEILPSWMTAECLYDANDETRKFTATLSNGHVPTAT